MKEKKIIKSKNLFFKEIEKPIPKISKYFIWDISDIYEQKNKEKWDDGVFILVPKKSKSEAEMTFLPDEESYSKHIILLEESSTLTLMQKIEGEKGMRNNSLNVFLGKNSHLSFYSLNKSNTISYSRWKFYLDNDSSLKLIFGEYGKYNNLKIDVFFKGKGSNAICQGIFYAKSKTIELTTNSFHEIDNTSNDILIKGAVQDGKAIYNGKIKILKEAQKTSSYLSEHVLLFGEKAFTNSVPSLEIDADDVRASHGASFGQVDEEDIFYLMSRGISKEKAERLLIQGHFTPILENLPIKIKREFQREII